MKWHGSRRSNGTAAGRGLRRSWPCRMRILSGIAGGHDWRRERRVVWSRVVCARAVMSVQLWMDAWRQAGVLGEELEQFDELAAIVGVEGGHEVGVVFVGGTLGLGEQ